MRYLLTILLFLSLTSHAQVNLVRNPSFEEYSQCPDNFEQITYANYWSGVDSVGINSCIPELCHTCATSGNTSVPFNGNFYQSARTGSALAQVQMYFDESWIGQNIKHDYLQGRLISPLVGGQSYCVTFFVNLAERSHYAINRISAYLDDGTIDTTSTCGLPQTQYTPQIENSLGVISDTMNWVKVEGSFVANGTEEFITIGNFYDTSSTSAIVMPYNSYSLPNDPFTWYLIDDVSVFPSDLQAFAGNDTGTYNIMDSLFLGRNEIGLDCKWYLDGNLVDSGAGITIPVPFGIDTYVVKQTLCGVVTWDTVVVWLADHVPYLNANNIQLKLSPNPVSAQLSITANVDIQQVTITDITGREVLRSAETTIDVSRLVSGVYFVRVRDVSGNTVTKKILKE